MLIYLRIEHPESFLQSEQSIFKSELYIIPKSKGLGIIGLAENVVGLYLSGEIKGSDGKPIPLITIARAFEAIFNVDFGNIYDLKGALFRRKSYNLTKALDMLKNAILREGKKQGI